MKVHSSNVNLKKVNSKASIEKQFITVEDNSGALEGWKDSNTNLLNNSSNPQLQPH